MQRTSISFDASVWELWTPLATGARLHLLPPAAAKDPAAIGRAIEEGGVTVAQFVPTLLQAVLGALPVGGSLPCRTLFCGGEPLSAALVAEARAAGVGEVVNLYGPTEATIDSTWHRCGADERAPSIGRPIANARVYLLDALGEPVPVGVAGELYVSGAGVARGYLNRPELTAERFVADPFSSENGARMYRTGDLARWLADGTIEFLGRTDFQVKIRGFRIEPGEVEARLAEHPEVREAVVLVREDTPGDKRLVAYVVGSGSVEADALRAYLSERMPEYMVPAAYVRLDALPLTPNGKLDRKALPAPEVDAYAAREYEPPVGTTEEALAEIWAEVLRVQGVGRHDSFFELGGHSLLAVQVISRVRQVLEVEVALGEVFTRPVLSDFARELEARSRAELQAIELADRGADLPLSFAQQRLWFIDQLQGAGAAYHMPTRLRLKGELDRAALVRALDRIVARHEALRTVFAETGGDPVQRIAPAEASSFHLVDHDLRGRADAWAELRRVMAEEAGARFDLAHGPLIRGRLVRMADDDHVLLITMHHIVSDGWSMGVLTHEIGALYAAFRAGHPDPLPPLPVQYADYAVWQRRWVEGEVLQAQAEYWKETLAGAPELLELPTDHARPARQDFSGGVAGIELNAELAAALKALSRRHGTTLFMTVMAGWAAVLSRLSGQSDVVVGTPSANRGRREIEGLIGFFVNTLALRVDLSGSPAVAETLARVKARALEAQANQDIPFEQVVELVQPARSMAHSPLFQVMFVWQNAPGGRLELPGLAQAPLGPPPRPGSMSGPVSEPASEPASALEPQVTAKFDLLLALAESGGGRIAGAVEYATSLFERATVERWAGYLRRVLEAMAAGDTRGVDRIPILAESERDLVVRAWNATEAEIPRRSCIHELFEAQAARTPGATALVFEGESLTYAELNRRANRLAHHLRSLAVGPDARVGICVERSVEMVVGLLAILKAGGAYVPLDAGYPVDRLRDMVEDSVPAVLLTHPPVAAVVAELTAGSSIPVVDLAGGAAWAHLPETNPGRGALTPESLGYVIFTSGSTGRPKGVMLEHGSLVNRLAWMQDRYGMTPDEALLQKTPFSFDVSFWEFFWPLMVGARLVVARPGGHRDPAYLADVIQREGITHAHFVPSMLQLFLEHPGAERCTGLLRVPVSGEAVSAALVRHFHERLPGVGLFNQYGPTESGEVTEWACDPGAERVSIGRAIHNSTVYVLDRAGQPAAIGVAGELFIGGIAVARGYLGRPGLTAERFVPDPFGAPGSRAYRTGDLCRWRADGNLEFLGRTDFQVKVRGFRVELGEIEARLAGHPAVREAVVVALDHGAGATRLAAWYTADAPVEAGALRAHLAAALPEYMIPAALVWMAAFPVTPNGKLDRRALPAPEADAFATSRGHEPPLGETEQALAAIWSELLGAERVGRHDHFFELGGHSLLAVRVISRVRQVLGAEVALADLFERPVLADLARAIGHAARTELPPIEPAERGADLPLSFAQQRLWFMDRLEGAGAAYHITERQRLRGELDRAALRRALDRIVARHEALRTAFPEVDGAPVQRIAPAEASRFHLTEHDLRGHAEGGAELRRLMADEADAPFDLARGPLIRGRLVRIGDDDHVLLITMHHIVSDGWSMGVFTRELNTLYAAFRAGEPDPLPALPVQYADYAVWQRTWVDGEVLKPQAQYWAETLGGAPELLELPTDRPRPARQDFSGGVLRFELDSGLTAELKALGQRHGATLFMTLLAGWAATLSRLSGQDEVVVGTPTANRGREEIEGLIGFFVNTLALRVDLSGSPSVADALARVKARALGAQANQDIPFEQVVERVQPARSLSHTPLFQVMFIWQNAPGHELELSGLAPAGSAPRPAPAAQPAAAAQTTAKFDLSLALAERGGRIVGAVEYAAALFDPPTVERFLGYLRRALEAMVADESRPVDAIDVLPEAERRLVLEEWNRTATTDDLAGACIHDLFEAQAERTPDAVAVVHEGDELTYAELNERANRLAHHLRGLGVGPEVRVGVCLQRGVEMVATLLGVLKAGGAYVPLDPAYPAERLAFTLHDSRVAVLLTQTSLRGLVPVSPGVRVVSIDESAGRIAAESAANPPGGATPRNLAYLIYTSGSTGVPKGVAIEHASAVTLVSWASGLHTAEELSGMLAATSICFDLSVYELFLPLARGGRVIVVENALALTRSARAGEVRLINTVPSAIAALLKHGGIPGGVTTVNLAGEPLKPALVDALYARGIERVYDLYGPSETTTYSTGTLRRAGGPETIGVPLANERTYVLDRALQPVPVGVAGELYIGGAGVARGYLGRAGLTAERFIPEPFGTEPGGRLYRTGDRARWRADGTLEYLGRLDAQVKVRGFRIELGEVEARLREHADVRDVVVVARDEAGGGKRLVAYCVGDAPTVEALRAHLSQRLPEYMVPSAFVWLEALPLTPNGKLDRKALPAPEGDAYARRGYQAPVGETEAALAEIWAELLKVERVGRHDHFFELGGHSLLAVQVISRVRQVLGAEMALADLFERPVLADLARGVGEAARAELPPIEPADRSAPLPLSFAQQRLWFMDRMEGTGSAYHLPARMRLKGELDRGALVRALDRVVERHEALRTVFPEHDGVAEQRIAPAGESRFSLAEHDLSGSPGAGRELARLAAEDARAPFDLARGPLIRGMLVRMAEDDHVLLVTMHHIVSDGWSMGVFTRELGALYGAFREGLPDPLPPLPVQYADYAAWQRRWMEGEVLRRQADYWTRALAGAPELLELPTDHARPARQDYTGATVSLVLGEALSASLKELSRRHGATLYMTLLAGWAATLSRLSGQGEVVVGTPTANRGRAEIEGLIGVFVNVLPVRVELSDTATVAELLGRVRERALGAQHHQDIPFEQVVELVRPVRSMAHAPLFQAMFTWQNAPGGGAGLPGLTLAPVEPAGPPERSDGGPSAPAASSAQVTANVDLSLTLWERGGRIAGSVTYAAALFERETVERYAGYLRRVLEGMAADQGRRVARLALMPETERARVLEEWNDTEAAYPRDLCIHQLFEAQAARTPGAVAIVSDAGVLTYAELDARAGRVARRLCALGVGPESRVALCVERSAEMVVALLGVLKAGGAYVPLDPSHPADRLGWILRDAAPAAVLAHGERSAEIDALLGAMEIPLLGLHDDAAAGDDPGPAGLVAGADRPAYVMYTSGSTGRPKGVIVPHRGVVNLLGSMRETVGMEPADRVLALTTCAFDISVLEIFLPLLHGARTIVLPAERSGDPAAVAKAIREHAPTVMQATPATWRMLVEGGWEGAPGLRALCGGEALRAELASAVRERVGALWNVYGPTETTIWSTVEEVTPASLETPGHVSIGRPVANTRVYVVDAAGEPVPVGVAGELCIGGDGVARGYRDRAGLTAERFVADPFSREPGARMYRTGDLARRRADGRLAFVGRTDFQVKVRGYRIELGEIETRLAEHADVREAVVVAREDAPGETRLVAYVVGGETAGAEVLRAHLGEVLPAYMVPSAFVRLEALPLTPNGKLDRSALPAPDAPAAQAYEAPLGETEEALAEIWAEVLGVERVGRRDNFFELGGHSLLAVRVVSRVRQLLEAEVVLAHVFSHPTVESLAARLAGAGGDPQRSDRAIAIRATGNGSPLFLVHEGMGSTRYAQVLHPHVDAGIPVYALPAASPAEPPLRTIEGMAARLVRMIREVQPSGPYRVAGWSFGGVLAYEVAAQLIGRDEVVEFVGMFDSYHPVRGGADAHEAAQKHALLLHVLGMGEAVEPSGRVELDEVGVDSGDAELETFVTRCRETGLLAGDVTVEQARQMRSGLRNQCAMHEYSPLPLPVAVHLFPAQGSADPELTRGWQATVPANRLRVTPVPGTHLSMMRAPNTATLGGALSRAIGRAREEAAAPVSAGGGSPLVTLQGGAAGAAPLFCVPGAGNGVTTFIHLLSALGPSVPVHGLQPRGLEGEAPPHATVQAAAEYYLRALCEACPVGPVHLLGHSFGGWVALEMALRLHQAGRPPTSLTILDSEVPDDSEAGVRECGAAEAFLKLVEVMELATERPFGIGPAEVASRDEAGWLKLLHGKMVEHGLIGARAQLEVLTGPFRTFARCLRTRYRPAGVYPGRLRLVLVDDPAMDEAANRAQFAEVERGWRKWAPDLVFSAGAGNHITALKPPHVAALAALLAEDRSAREG
ncbi:MAG TPA: amino acid adenylation domain-containing protein [Longimicrobium sp.]